MPPRSPRNFNNLNSLVAYMRRLTESPTQYLNRTNFPRNYLNRYKKRIINLIKLSNVPATTPAKLKASVARNTTMNRKGTPAVAALGSLYVAAGFNNAARRRNISQFEQELAAHVRGLTMQRYSGNPNRAPVSEKRR